MKTLREIANKFSDLLTEREDAHATYLYWKKTQKLFQIIYDDKNNPVHADLLAGLSTETRERIEADTFEHWKRLDDKIEAIEEGLSLYEQSPDNYERLYWFGSLTHSK